MVAVGFGSKSYLQKMWKKFTANNSSYFLDAIKENGRFKIFATDYLNLWFVNFSKTSFVDCVKESNPELELKDDILMEKAVQMLSNPEGLKTIDIKIDGPTMVLFISMSFGYTVNIKLKLLEGSKEMFFQKVTQPLLKMIQSLQSSDKELQILLKKKDREIGEFKSEGFKVSRHLKTAKFDEQAHKSKYNMFEENFGTPEIPNVLLEKFVVSPEEKDMVTRTPIEIKLEHEEQTANIKIEPETSAMKFPNSSTVTSPTSIKRELVKTEPGILGNRKKRVTKLNL